MEENQLALTDNRDLGMPGLDLVPHAQDRSFGVDAVLAGRLRDRLFDFDRLEADLRSYCSFVLFPSYLIALSSFWGPAHDQAVLDIFANLVLAFPCIDLSVNGDKDAPSASAAEKKFLDHP